MMLRTLQVLLHRLYQSARFGLLHPFVQLSHYWQAHRDMKPVKQVFGQWIQVQLMQNWWLHASSAAFLRSAVSVQAILHRAGVGLKPLHLGQTHDLGTESRQRASRCLNEVGALEEIVYAQR